jgi:hypothetical protein
MDSDQSVQGKNRAIRFVEFLEHPLFLYPCGIIGGVVGLLRYTPAILITAACFLGAFHRAKVVHGLHLKIQAIAYSVIFLIATVLAWWGVHSLRATAQTELNELKQYFGGISTQGTKAPSQPLPSNQPSTPPSTKVTTPTSASPGPMGSPEARLLMSRALITPLKNTITSARGFGVNFVYANRGTIPTTGQVHKGSIAVSSEALSREDILRFMREVSSFKALPELQNGGDEIYPNDPNEHFFSMPDTDEKIAELASSFDDVMAGKKRVYFFVTIKFRDKSMSPFVVGVSQTCGWFLQDLAVVHNCGVDRLYFEVEK